MNSITAAANYWAAQEVSNK